MEIGHAPLRRPADGFVVTRIFRSPGGRLRMAEYAGLPEEF